MGANYNPKISIIVPVYNSEKYLSDCINSILNQTFTDFELILIDDGSTDSSGAICDEFSLLDQRVVVRHKENGGICSARNLGLDISQGDYIGFCDSDDLINKYMYEILFNTINKRKSSLVMGECKTFTSEKVNCEEISEVIYKDINKDEFFKNMYGTGEIDYQYMVVWNKLYDRVLFNDIRFDDPGAEDLEINNKLINISKDIIVINTMIYFWRQHNESVTHQKFGKRNIDSLNTYIKCYKYLVENSETKYAHMCIYKWFKVALNNRYNSKKSDLENEAINAINSQFNQYYKVFLKSKYIDIKDKVIFSIFRFIPFTYDAFRKITEV